jgi:two-component system sensor histidine kinase KdpD
VRVDAAQIERVLVNLLENALKFSSSAEPVEVRLGSVGEEVQTRVLDCGPGLPPAELDRIFEPFERGRAATGGTGLGLAIARGFAETNGGRVWAEALESGGAAFVLALPAAPMPARVRA